MEHLLIPIHCPQTLIFSDTVYMQLKALPALLVNHLLMWQLAAEPDGSCNVTNGRTAQ